VCSSDLTGFIAEQMSDWHSSREDDADLALAVTAVAEYSTSRRGMANSGESGSQEIPTPWDTLGHFRLHGMG